MAGILAITTGVVIVLVILVKYITTARITSLKRHVVEAEEAARGARGRLRSAENEKAIAERNEGVAQRKKEAAEKQIEKLTKELGSLNV
jgi:predicted Holliday junction resolvase-like endonuclease